MRIGANADHIQTIQRTSTGSAAAPDGMSFASALTSATTDRSAVKKTDFTSMTRQEMFDWMNEQIRSGKMSIDESSAFLGMTLKISAVTGQPVDMATDSTRINFVEKARTGIEGAMSRNEKDTARRLQMALDIMQRKQG